MIRPLEMADWQDVATMLADWPLDKQGPCTTDRCISMMRLWMQQNHPYIYEKDGKVRASNYLRPNDWRWTVSEDYQDVKAERKYGSTWKIIFESKPYKK